MSRFSSDLSATETLSRIVRVDQAGEYGAARIYAGQLAVLKKSASAAAIEEMAEQEQKHLSYFNDQIKQRGVRPTALQPLWHIGGWAMGAATALLGEKAAMACTVAVESVISDHYARQSETLEAMPEEAELKQTIEQFRAEEMEHHDTALEHKAEDAPFYAALSTVVRAQTKLAIWLSERV